MPKKLVAVLVSVAALASLLPGVFATDYVENEAAHAEVGMAI